MKRLDELLFPCMKRLSDLDISLTRPKPVSDTKRRARLLAPEMPLAVQRGDLCTSREQRERGETPPITSKGGRPSEAHSARSECA